MSPNLTLILLYFGIFLRVNAMDSRVNYIDEDSDKLYEPSPDYNDKITEIFGIPMESDEPTQLTGCANVVCVPYYLCINDVVVVNGTDLFEWRLSGSQKYDHNRDNMLCDDMEMPCCADNVYAAIVNAVNDPNNVAEFVQQMHVSPLPADETRPKIGQCGFQFNGKPPSHRRLTARALNGETTEPMEFPWMVGIFKRTSTGKLLYLGGGSIIHSHIILTAAHFLVRVKKEDMVIRAGIYDVLLSQDDVHQQKRNVSRFVIHDDVYTRALINDIALLVIDKPLEWNRFVNPICLPPQGMGTPIGTECMASGWGKDSDGRDGSYQRLLKKIDLPIVDTEQCQKKLRTTRLGPYFRLHQSLLCAGGSGADTCKGDGGSPLVCPIPSMDYRYYQCGIVAGGIGCGGRMPAMYVDVSHFTDWIKEQLWHFNLAIERQNELSYDLFVSNHRL